MMEHSADAEGDVIMLRHPDGGFRRFRYRDANFSSLDGAHPAVSEDNGPYILLSVGDDRYRLPKPLPLYD